MYFWLFSEHILAYEDQTLFFPAMFHSMRAVVKNPIQDSKLPGRNTNPTFGNLETQATPTHPWVDL